MFNLAGWFVVGAIPVGGAVSPWSGWLFPGIGMVMLVLLTLLAADTVRPRVAWSRWGARSKRSLGTAERPSFGSPRCAPVTGL